MKLGNCNDQPLDVLELDCQQVGRNSPFLNHQSKSHLKPDSYLTCKKVEIVIPLQQGTCTAEDGHKVFCGCIRAISHSAIHTWKLLHQTTQWHLSQCFSVTHYTWTCNSNEGEAAVGIARCLDVHSICLVLSQKEGLTFLPLWICRWYPSTAAMQFQMQPPWLMDWKPRAASQASQV